MHRQLDARREPLLASRAALAIIELIGFGLAVYLSLIAFHVIHNGQVPCLRSRFVACDSVVRGQWSKIGPFSIAAMGVAYFAGQLMLTMLLGRARAINWLKLLSVFAGLAFVAWLRALEIAYMRKLCPWCWGVAAAVVLELAFALPLAMPLFPRMRVFHRVLAAGVLLFAFLGLTLSAEVLTNASKKGTNRLFGWKPATSSGPAADAESPRAVTTGTATLTTGSVTLTTGSAARADTTTGSAVIQPATPETSGAVAVISGSEASTTSATVAATGATTGTTTTVQLRAPDANDPPEPSANPMEIEEIKILEQRGWRVVASTPRLEELVKTRAPVLLMVFDPLCEECHATIREGLNADAVSALPVTRVAIDQGSLNGPLSALAPKVPTLLLLDQAGQVLYRHEARIRAPALVAAINGALGK